MKNIEVKKITKLMTVVAVAATVMGTCVACGNSTNAENPVSANESQEAASNTNENTDNKELATYEFETFDGVKVVIDESNIVTQESSDDPEHSELISEAAINNIVSPGRDYIYFADDDFYYVADLNRKLVTVATKSDVQIVADDEEMDNPGSFETDSWSISYDTDKWFGYASDDGSVIINNLNAVAGSSYIEIFEADSATANDAITMLENTRGKALVDPEKVEMNGKECYITYDEVGYAGEGVYIADFYIIHEHDGKVIIIDESITHDEDGARAEALSYEFDDVVNTFAIK